VFEVNHANISLISRRPQLDSGITFLPSIVSLISNPRDTGSSCQRRAAFNRELTTNNSETHHERDGTRSHSASLASGLKSSALGLEEIVDRYPVRYLDLAIGGSSFA
jgi:hypothetical protein